MRKLAAAIATCLIVSTLAACAVGPRPVDFSRLRYQVGAYLVRPNEIRAATAAGLTVGHGSWVNNARARATAHASGLSVLDARIQNRMYNWLYRCTGSGHCVRPNEERLDEFENWVANMVRHDQTDDAPIAGYYVLDDYWADMRAGLTRAHRAVREFSDAPVVCGLALRVPLVSDPGDTVTDRIRSQFSKALRNYSPRWCDAVIIYSYRIPNTQSEGNSPPPAAEWDMRRTLPTAIAKLKAAGFNFEKNMLIGAPGAFQYAPRTVSGDGTPISPPQYRWGPSPAQLVRQVKAFCAAGATGIVAYSWDTWSGPSETTKALSSSPSYRTALLAGVRQCHWPN